MITQTLSGGTTAPVSNQEAGLKVPYNWDITLLERFGKINQEPDTLLPIREVYGADRYSLTGSGRGGNALSKREQSWSEHFSEAHRWGIKFNYLFNAISLAGKEWDKSFQDKFLSTVGQLVDCGVDIITVTNPRLTLLVKEKFPELEVSPSINNHLDSVERVRQLVNYMGIDRIMLDHRVSRNFKLVEEVHKAFPEIPIVVLVNESCLRDCVLQPFHQEYLGGISRMEYQNRTPPPDLCHLFCATEKLTDPAHCLKAPWLRPEDVKHLVAAGATLIKLAGRSKDSEWITNLVIAYAKGKYRGNVFQFVEKSGLSSPEWEGYLGKKMPPARYQVDNKSLDGFISPFLKGTVPCVKGEIGCGSCRWCYKWLHAVSEPPNKVERLGDLGNLMKIVKSTEVALAA